MPPVRGTGPTAFLTSQSLAALLALVGSKRIDVDTLRSRMKLTNYGFGALLSWLQREYLVDVVSNLEGERVRERVELTERGEQVLLELLQNMCELPEFR